MVYPDGLTDSIAQRPKMNSGTLLEMTHSSSYEHPLQQPLFPFLRSGEAGLFGGNFVVENG